MSHVIQDIFLGDIPNHRVSKGRSKVFGTLFSLGELKNVKDITFRSLAGIEEVNLGCFLVDVEAPSIKEGVETVLHGFFFVH